MQIPVFQPAGGTLLRSLQPSRVTGLQLAGDPRCHNACASGFAVARNACGAVPPVFAGQCAVALDETGFAICNALC